MTRRWPGGCAERWLGAWPTLEPIEERDAWATGRRAWHRVAEHVLGPPASRDRQDRAAVHPRWHRHAVQRDAGGRPAARVQGIELSSPDRARPPVPLTTLRAAADASGVRLGTGTGVYVPTTRGDPDEPVTVTPDGVVARRVVRLRGLRPRGAAPLRAGCRGDAAADLARALRRLGRSRRRVGRPARHLRGVTGRRPAPASLSLRDALGGRRGRPVLERRGRSAGRASATTRSRAPTAGPVRSRSSAGRRRRRRRDAQAGWRVVLDSACASIPARP